MGGVAHGRDPVRVRLDAATSPWGRHQAAASAVHCKPTLVSDLVDVPPLQTIAKLAALMGKEATKNGGVGAYVRWIPREWSSRRVAVNGECARLQVAHDCTLCHDQEKG